MNWPQAYIIPETPCGFGTAASPSPTTTLLIIRGFGPPTRVETSSAKRTTPRRRNPVPAAFTSGSDRLFPEPSKDRYSIVPCCNDMSLPPANCSRLLQLRLIRRILQLRTICN